MTSAIDRAAELLFGNDERRLLNIRFLCGGSPNVSAEELAEQIILAETQIGSGHARRVVGNVDSHLTVTTA